MNRTTSSARYALTPLLVGGLLAAALFAAGCAGAGPAADTSPSMGDSPGAAADTIPRAPYDVEEITYPELPGVQVPEVERLDLDNGLTVFLLEDHELPTVSASARINAGEVYVPAEKAGLASLAGTVMRTGGTENLSSDSLNLLLENLGATVETSMGETSGSAYMNTLVEHVGTVLPAFAHVLRRPAFDAEKLEQAQTQAKSGISRRNDNPQQIAFREFAQVIYGEDSPYARTPEYYTIDAVTREDLVAFHKRYVQPEGIILSVWGDFDTDQMAQRIREAFGDWQTAPDYTEPTPPEPTATLDRSVNFIPKEDVTQSTILIGHVGEVTRENPDYFPLIVMNEVLSGGFTSRLFQTVRTDLGLAYAVFGSYGAGYERPGLFQAGTFTKNESTIEATRVILEEIEKLKNAPPTEAEVALAKDAYLNSFVFNFDSKTDILGRLMTYEYYDYPRDFLEETRQGIQQVTPEDVHRVAEQYLHPAQAHILILGRQDAFDAPVSALAESGTVNEIDITIPTAPPSEAAPAASAEDQAQGRELLAEVRQAMGGAALDEIESMRQATRTTAQTPAGEQTIEATVTVALPDRFRAETTLPNGMAITIVDDGQQMMLQSPQGTMTAPPPVRRQATSQLQRNLVYLMTQAEALEVADAGTETVGGAEYRALRLTPPGADAPLTLYVDPETMRPARMAYQGAGPGGAPVEQTAAYADFQTVDGVLVPFTTTVYQNGEEAGTTTVTDLAFNVEPGDDLFTLE